MVSGNGSSGRHGYDGNVEHAIVGVGWHFPVRVDLRRPYELASVGRARGGIAMARYDTDIEQAIRIIVSTRPGERRMRPTFGCQVHELVFAPLNATTFGFMRRYVEEALTLWEPRIDVSNVEIVPTPEHGWVDIEIVYQIRATKDERTLVYPFYLIGEE